MVNKIIFGKPIQTFSVIKNIKKTKKIDYFHVEEFENEIKFSYALGDDDYVYGLGEAMGGINRRGRRYVSFNVDNINHDVNSESTYSSHNFLIVDGKNKFGVFFDTPSEVIFEIDYNNNGFLNVECKTKNLILYIIKGESAYQIAKSFLKIIGKSFVPPLWGFGYGQSRWGYACEKDFETVVDGYRKNHIPLDYVCMDIDYMDRYIDFTINEKAFPDMKNFVSKLKNQNVYLVPIIDAGIKVEKGNKIYDEGVRNNYFCKDKNMEYFEALVWPGITHFVDFFQKKASKWFGKKIKFLTDYGFNGFWIDMNEPSIFASEFDESKNNEENQKHSAYKNFYHKINRKYVNHFDVHNVYGHLMIKSLGEGLKKLLNERYFLFARSTYIGSHRYAGIWTGDNKSSWSHLKQNVFHMPSLNMCGFLFSGADTGGFRENCDAQLLLRWLAFSVFTPLMKNHSNKGTTPQECYSMGNIESFRSIVSLRYKLLPYIYSEYIKCVLYYDMFIKPLSFEYGGEEVRKIEDQLLIGESIMIAPIIEQDTESRDVFVPEDMIKVHYDGKDFKCLPIKQGWHKITMKLNEVVFFIRKNKLVPVCEGAEDTNTISLDNVTLLGDGKRYTQYIDDGFEKKIDKRNIRVIYKN